MLDTTLVSMNSIIECKQVIFAALFVRSKQVNNSLYNQKQIVKRDDIVLTTNLSS
jgi:hypothetical protein